MRLRTLMQSGKTVLYAGLSLLNRGGVPHDKNGEERRVVRGPPCETVARKPAERPRLPSDISTYPIASRHDIQRGAKRTFPLRRSVATRAASP
ncbi:hypothetical protein BCEP27_110004 [Burkholderia cepacia]